MAPFHPLRHGARALVARAGAAFAVFTVIAVLLLAGGSDGPLARAAAHEGEPAAGSAVAAGQEASQATPPPEAGPPAEVAAPPDAAGVTAPVGDEGKGPVEPDVPDEPMADEPDEGTAELRMAPGHDGAWGDPNGGKGGIGSRGHDHPGYKPEPSGGHFEPPGNKPDPSGGHFEPPGNKPDPSGGSGRRPGKPTGGSKDPDPTDGGTGADPAEPAPAGRPQTQPVPGAGSVPGQPGAPTSQPTEPVSDGKGAVVDGGDTGDSSSGNQLTARGGDSAEPGGGTGGTTNGGGTGTSTGGTSETTTATGAGGSDTTGAGATGGDNGTGTDNRGDGGDRTGKNNGPVRTVTNTVTREVERLVNYVPDGIKAALAALAALSIVLGAGYLLAAVRARRLDKQRHELLQEVGLLQSALLPPVPDRLGSLRTSVAYRPADGPGAGGDFYDVLPLPGGRVGFILGDVSGHGRGALARTAFMRYTLRAYLEAGLEPRVALQVAGRVIDDNLGGDFATVLLAVHDPETGSLTYATAGHPAPIVAGPQPHDPVTAGSSPPIGVGVRTGLRQTTVPLVPGSVACLFTDGLMEARTPDGILGRERLCELVAELGEDASARRLIESVAAQSNNLSDDMAAVVVSPTTGVTTGLFRTEQLELSARELEGPIARRFLEACGLPPYEVEDAEHDARLLAERFGGVVLHVVFGNRLRVEVLPRNVESIEAASRRVSAGSAR